ncbi:MAG: RnfABCDGE type electron transport complex subunit D [Chitinispirillaceae bacterium]|jgi:electron transport complex protein RnfD|nr:RnfABCDGE type electron transport complex subunit D [Chitinispirillaceae bacterium]
MSTDGDATLLLTVSSAPHCRSADTVTRTMLWVLLALVPALVMTTLLFGVKALLQIALSAAAAVAVEWLITSIRTKKPVLPDGTAACTSAITGILLALSLPPNLPLWIAPCGSLFAIAVVKMAFGGTGRNFLNPALAGRAFCLLAFPALFTGTANAAALSPLQAPFSETVLNLFMGYQGVCMGGSSAGALLAGAILLWSLRRIDFTLPLAFITSVFLLSWLTDGNQNLFTPAAFEVPLLRILSGGTLLGAFFFATDPVTSPQPVPARLVFGMGCGALTVVFSRSGSAGDSVMYAILLMNCMTPYLDRLLMHRPIGAAKSRGNAHA